MGIILGQTEDPMPRAPDEYNLFDALEEEEGLCPHGNVARDCEMDCVCGDACDSHNADGSCRDCGCLGYEEMP